MTDRASAVGVLFDLDGTLVNSLPTIAEAMSRTLGDFGHEVAPDAILPLIGAPMQTLAQQLTEVSDEVAAEMYERYLRLYYDEFIQTTQPLTGASELLDRLGAAGARLAVVTNKNEHGGKLMVEILGWERHFDVVVGRDTTPHPKPAPDGPLHALAALGVTAEDAAFVGDTEFDMAAAQSASVGIRIGLLGARSATQLEASGATHIVETLDEVDAIILESRAAGRAAAGG